MSAHLKITGKTFRRMEFDLSRGFVFFAKKVFPAVGWLSLATIFGFAGMVAWAAEFHVDPDKCFFLSGVSYGAQESASRIFRWPLTLDDGENRIMARAASGHISHECVLTFENTQPK